MSKITLSPPPLRDAISEDGKSKPVNNAPRWAKWFGEHEAHHNALSPGVGADVGNADTTLTWGTSYKTQVYNTPIDALRTITLSTSKAVNGSRFRVVRTAAATGGFNVSVGGLKNLTAGTWCEVEHDGTAWFLSAAGSL